MVLISLCSKPVVNATTVKKEFMPTVKTRGAGLAHSLIDGMQAEYLRVPFMQITLFTTLQKTLSDEALVVLS